MAPAATSIRRARPADTAGLEVALVERALADGGLLFTRASPGLQCFYRLSLQPTLFGGCDLLREWGRLAPTQVATRCLVEHYAGLSDALAPLGHAVRVRLRHGYRARALPARFIPSAAKVYWCPAPAAGQHQRDSWPTGGGKTRNDASRSQAPAGPIEPPRSGALHEVPPSATISR